MKPGVRKGGDEGAEGGVAQLDAVAAAGAAHREGDRQGDDRERRDEVDREQHWIGEAAIGRLAPNRNSMHGRAKNRT